MSSDFYNKHIEQVVLGQMILESELIHEIGRNQLSVDSFFDRKNRSTFESIVSLLDGSDSLDTVILHEHLQRKLPEVDWFDYLTKITEDVVTTATFSSHCEALNELRKKREINKVLTSVKSRISQESSDVIIKELDSVISNATEEYTDFEASSTSLQEEILRDFMSDKKPDSFLSTGYDRIDDLIGDIRSSQIYTIAARPGQGKTTLLLNIIENIRKSVDGVNVIISLEMDKKDLERKRLSIKTKIPVKKLEGENVSTSEIHKIMNAMEEDKEGGIIEYTDSPFSDLRSLSRLLRRVKKIHGKISSVSLDFLQLVKFDKSERRDLAIGEFLYGLKPILKEIDAPMFLLSQLNRSVDQRTSHEPILSDLRDSGAIEDVSAGVIFLYSNDEEKEEGILNIKVAKARYGKIGNLRMTFKGDTGEISYFNGITNSVSGLSTLNNTSTSYAFKKPY